MAAIVRVKRHLDEEPLDALILNCKRRKTADELENEEPELSAVLKFAGTIKSQDEDILKHLKKPTKNKLEEDYKKHSIDINAKLRAQNQQASKNSRYKIVNCFRSQNQNVEETEAQSAELTVYDIENERDQLEDVATSKPKETDYVYDLYYTNSDDLGDASLEEYVSVCPLTSSDLVFGSYRDNDIGRNESDADSEDSNAENNWRNDYPDEDDVKSLNEDDMIEAMEKVDIGYDLSSDEGEEGFAYGNDNEATGFEGDSFDQKYGERYARFRTKYNTSDSSRTEREMYSDSEDDYDY